MSERKGDWIQTASGRSFYPLDPRPDEIDIRDIAHSLSLTCRFRGHCQTYYSVAEHSVRCAEYLERLRPWDKKLQLWGLLHDAAECMLCDVPRPIKPFLTGFKEIEDNISKAVAEKFDLPWPMHMDVKLADNVLLATEARDLMGHDAYERWGKDMAVPLEEQIIPLHWWMAENLFLETFERLRAA
jgi:hypothetical protein